MRVVFSLDVAVLRAIAIGDDGSVAAEATAAYETVSLGPGLAEQRPEDWWSALEAAFSAIGHQVGLRDVTEIELSGELPGGVFLDGDSEVIRPAIVTGDERIAGGFGAVMAWLRTNQTIAFKRVQHLLTPRSYMRHRLTGVFAIEAEDAARTGLFDVDTDGWSRERCSEMEVNVDILPALLGANAELWLRADVAEAFGLPRGTLVAG